MIKIDLQKQYRGYYEASVKPELIQIEKAVYLSIIDMGDPSSQQFSDNIQALYTTAFALKFHCKRRDQDFKVAKLEGLWWYDEAKYPNMTITNAPSLIPRSEWCYQLLIRIPEFAHPEDLAKVAPVLLTKKKNTRVENVKYHEIQAHTAVQALHSGPFDTEPDTLRKIMEYMSEHHLEKAGLHHEIYLSDFRKTRPDNVKTILREPVKQP